MAENQVWTRAGAMAFAEAGNQKPLQWDQRGEKVVIARMKWKIKFQGGLLDDKPTFAIDLGGVP